MALVFVVRHPHRREFTSKFTVTILRNVIDPPLQRNFGFYPWVDNSNQEFYTGPSIRNRDLLSGVSTFSYSPIIRAAICSHE